MMWQRFYRFAGVDCLVEMAEEVSYREEGRLAPFAVETVTDPHRFRFEIVGELPKPEGAPITVQPNFCVFGTEEQHVRYIGSDDFYIRAEHAGKNHHVQVRENPYTDRIGTRAVLEAMEIEHLIARNMGFILHCSYTAYQGKAILFTAPSETGKSTQAELWKRHRGAQIINGDRAAVRLADGVLMAEGIPFSGSSQYCENRSLPIAAIVYLGQAPQTTIRRMRGYEAFAKIWEGVSVDTWDKTDMELVSGVVQMIAEQIPVFHLPCTPDETAVIALEQALRKQECE